MYMCIVCWPGTCRSQKRAPDTPILELQIDVSWYTMCVWEAIQASGPPFRYWTTFQAGSIPQSGFHVLFYYNFSFPNALSSHMATLNFSRPKCWGRDNLPACVPVTSLHACQLLPHWLQRPHVAQNEQWAAKETAFHNHIFGKWPTSDALVTVGTINTDFQRGHGTCFGRGVFFYPYCKIF